MKEEGNSVSLSKLCKWFGFNRQTIYYKPKRRAKRELDQDAVQQVREVMNEFPTYGVPRITAVLNKRRDTPINHKKVERIVQTNNWQVRKRVKGHRPRAFGWRSECEKPNERWAIDQSHIFCGKDGWCHLTAIIDCCDRTIVGWRLSKSGKSGVAAAVLEEGIRTRKLQNCADLTIRSDNGLIFGAKPFVRSIRRFGLQQEFITPYTPQQNGMIERFFRSIKEECIWQQKFDSRDDAFEVIADWMEHYNEERPHSALSYLSPKEFSLKLAA
jgi:putative transposase